MVISKTLLMILMIRRFLENLSKYLIFLCFDDRPEKLWITLLKTHQGCLQTLKNQAFRQIARLLSRSEASMKSTT